MGKETALDNTIKMTEAQVQRVHYTTEGQDYTRATGGSAGVDLRARTGGTLNPGERALVPTGLRVHIPEGWAGDIRPRSGLALKHGVTVINTPGTVDSDYRGEVGVLLINHGAEPFTWEAGDRIAQMVTTMVSTAPWVKVDSLDDTGRAGGGWGSTGTA